VRNLRRGGEPAPVTVAISTPQDRAFVTFNGMNVRLPGRLRQAIGGMRARHVHFAFGPPSCRPWRGIVRTLRRQGIGTSWDFGWYPRLQADPHFWSLATMVDYLFVNRDEAIAYAPGARSLKQAIDRWRTSLNTVVIKLGAAGGRIVGSGVDLRGKAMTVRVVDTTGAGDAFNAGFLAARLRGLDLTDALQLANRVGALSTQRAGGLAGLPRIRFARA
jgi:ribokinase